MKNIILLILFFAGIAVMANVYFIPRLNEENNLDFLDAELQEIAQMIPTSATLYYLPTEAPNDAEIRYKTLFSMVPRVMVLEKSGKIPKDSLMIRIEDESQPQTITKNDTVLQNSQLLISRTNRFNVKLLRKN